MKYEMKVGTTIGEQIIYKSQQLGPHVLLVTDESMTGGQDPIAVRRGVHLDGFSALSEVTCKPEGP